MLDLIQLQPFDEHNRQLEAHIHPPDWVNPTPTGRYNLVVLGAGTAGLVTAVGAAGLGAKVALVEKHLMGGDCLTVGCVPSKGIISAARAAAAVRNAGEFGVRVPDGVEVDFGAAMDRMRRLRAGIARHDSASRFQGLGVDVFLGEGRFTGPKTVEVGEATLQFKKAAICTGARASAPPIPGLQNVHYLTNESVFSLTELPPRLAVIGAGPIGCELAQTFARLGSEVWLIEATHGILPREDPECSEIVRQSILRDGVQLLCCGKQTQIAPADDGIRITLESHEQQYEIEVDQLLVSAGRAPNVENLGLETVGVEYDNRTGVKVDDTLRTTNPRIYAAGDICSQFKFTHAADFMARTIIRNALLPVPKAKISKLVIPWCTYTSPEIAHVGVTPQSAAERGIAIDTYSQPFDGVDRAVLEGETEGLVKIHTTRGSDRILGATIVAANAGDLISEVTLAMTCGIGLGKLANSIHPYPTQAEAIRKTGDAYNRTRLTAAAKKVFGWWMSFTR